MSSSAASKTLSMKLEVSGRYREKKDFVMYGVVLFVDGEFRKYFFRNQQVAAVVCCDFGGIMFNEPVFKKEDATEEQLADFASAGKYSCKVAFLRDHIGSNFKNCVLQTQTLIKG